MIEQTPETPAAAGPLQTPEAPSSVTAETAAPAPAAAPSAVQTAEQPRNLVRDLIDSGIHFGHRASRWNPKMGPFIYGKRNKIHIIDIRETLKGLLRARKFVAQLVAGGEDVVFVGTKRQAKLSVQEQAERCGMPYVNERWLGGTLTNFRTIRSRLGRLEELEALEQAGRLDAFSKKEAASLSREKRKILRNLGGIRTMNRLPAAMIVIDVRREHIAVKEAQKMDVATVALIDTDSDPDYADLPIPGNDDAMRGIELVLTELADAVIEGKSGRAAAQEAAGKEAVPAPRRRSRRPTTSQLYEQQLTPTEQRMAETPPSVLETVAGAEEAKAAQGQTADEAVAPADAPPAPADQVAASAEPPAPAERAAPPPPVTDEPRTARQDAPENQQTS